ncbi:DUF6509 family protein [Bacillus sp. DTU_2020_1000418_1_SI_GHA_SEK_038]|uniref:DUF6509 family protein n=1 Tax=Bacillus sp. DTU_2020_1000418_1_SI_GHA_SEK_038 TaxID=3077585 RepID=UPI0028ECC3F0|nr:DUF6509 family protein [Bacillus sp. DTU_2020_1000418_1_SI_GHA_SEK_038]WNS73841.1 DUF6509 family protein [Bacillus sp. DTU_2020_1000418_1_SI_GHA_SEK_038]
MEITSYTVEQLKDPTGILLGDRFEFFLDIAVNEDDDLYSENGLQLRVLFYKKEDDFRILNYHFLSSDQILDFALEEDEEKLISKFCMDHYIEAEDN